MSAVHLRIINSTSKFGSVQSRFQKPCHGSCWLQIWGSKLMFIMHHLWCAGCQRWIVRYNWVGKVCGESESPNGWRELKLKVCGQSGQRIVWPLRSGGSAWWRCIQRVIPNWRCCTCTLLVSTEGAVLALRPSEHVRVLTSCEWLVQQLQCCGYVWNKSMGKVDEAQKLLQFALRWR